METQKDEFFIKWKIVYYNFLSLKRGEMLRSPPFNIGISDPLFLELYPRGDILDSDGESIIVSLNNNNLTMYSVTECDLSLQSANEAVSFKQEKYFDRLKWAFKEAVPEMHILDRFGELTLTIKCLFCKNKNAPKPDHVEMKALSQDFENLYASQQFSDLTIITGKEEFPVHECILASRIPKLMNHLKPVERNGSSNTKEIANIDSETLKFLLFYAYTGNLPALMSNIPDGLYKAVEMFQLNDLKQKLYFSPMELNAYTSVGVDHIKFEWNLKDLDDIENMKICSPAIPGGNIFHSNFKLICHMMKKADEKCKVTKIYVQQIVSGKEVPLYVKLRIHGYGNEFFRVTADHTFSSNEEWLFPREIEFPGKNLTLCCEFYVSSGEKSSMVKTESCDTKYKNVSYDSEDLSQFCSDLGQLYNIFLPKMSDISLHVGDVRFPVHKAILAARSDVFSRMFETEMMEKQSGIVKITDIELDKVNMMLSYIYSSKLEIVDATTAMDMYSVADKYEIASLKKKCSLYLKAVLMDVNACDILIFADMHSNENLKAAAKHYLCTRAKRILRTSIFKALIDKRPDLASEVLHELLNVGTLILRNAYVENTW